MSLGPQFARRTARPKARVARGIASGLILAGTLSAGIWGLMQNPFSQPLIQRSTASAERALERAFRDTFTPDWLQAELEAALKADDRDRALWLANLAQAEALPLPQGTKDEIELLRQEEAAWGKAGLDCLSCSFDIRKCGSLQEIALCGLPVELSPIGDVTALIRQGLADEVDPLETGLALVGLGATALLVVTGGTSYSVKAGASVLRAAKRLGSLTPEFARSLGALTDLPLNMRAALRAAPLDEITDTAQLARLGRVVDDLGTVARNTSTAEALRLMRHIDSPEDAARMARLSEAAKSRTLSRVEVLGKSRSFRALLRLSDLTITALVGIYAAALNLLILGAKLLGGRLLRAALR